MYNKSIILTSRSLSSLFKDYINIQVTVMFILNVGPMGPRGLGPNPFSTVSQMPSGGFFWEKQRPQKNNAYLSKKWRIFAMLANVDLNLRLKICKMAI